MFDDLLDRIVARLMAAAGLIMAAAIGAVAAAMSLFAFLAPVTGSAWAYAILTLVAGGVVLTFALVQQRASKTRSPPIEDRLATMIDTHPSMALAVGLATGAFLRGKSSARLGVTKKRR